MSQTDYISPWGEEGPRYPRQLSQHWRFATQCGLWASSSNLTLELVRSSVVVSAAPDLPHQNLQFNNEVFEALF